jgi:hypothetical protein
LSIVRGSTSTLSFNGVTGAQINSVSNNQFLADTVLGAINNPVSTVSYECFCGVGYSQGGSNFYNEDSYRETSASWFRFRDSVTGTQGIPVHCTGMILSLRLMAHHFDNAFDDLDTVEICYNDPGPVASFYTACIPQPEAQAETRGRLTFLSADPGLAVAGTIPTFVGTTLDVYSGMGLLANDANLESRFRLLILDEGQLPVPCYGVALQVYPSTTFSQCGHTGGIGLDAFRGSYYVAPS